MHRGRPMMHCPAPVRGYVDVILFSAPLTPFKNASLCQPVMDDMGFQNNFLRKCAN